MKSIEQIRREKLTILEKEAGGLTQLSTKTGISKSQLGQWKNALPDSKTGKPRNMRSDSARKLEKKTGKPPQWMDQDPDAITAHLAATETGSDTAKFTGHIGNVSPGQEIKGLCPVISYVQAGEWGEVEDHFAPGDADEWRPCPVNHGPHTYAVRVQGDSMTAPFGRTYPPGCMIFVDPDQKGGVGSGDRVIAKINGEPEVTFKVFVEEAGKRFLKPLNPQYPIITDEFRIIGKVIGKWEDE